VAEVQGHPAQRPWRVRLQQIALCWVYIRLKVFFPDFQADTREPVVQRSVISTSNNLPPGIKLMYKNKGRFASHMKPAIRCGVAANGSAILIY
jgi:hypothetical protein